MKRKNQVSIYDLAAASGFSVSTVSRALNDNSRISKKTRTKVKRLAREMGFSKNALASGLNTQRTNIIGVIVPQLNREFFSSAIHSIEDAAFELGYSIMICQSKESYEREKAHMEALVSSRVDGVIVSLSLETADYGHFEAAKEKGIPVVFFDRVPEDTLRATKIVIDDFQAAYRATCFLLDQGYRRVAHIAGPAKQQIFTNRLNGYRQALLDNNLSFDPNMVLYTYLMSLEEGYRAAGELLTRRDRPDAIFTANNLMAISTIACALDKHIKVPRELGVLGFSEESVSSLVRPSASSVRQPSVEMGRLAVEQLIKEVEAEGEEDVIYQKITLETQLIARASTERNIVSNSTLLL